MQISKRTRATSNFSLRSLMTFIAVGGMATALQYSILVATVYWLSWPVQYGSTFGFGISAIANYLLNARLTFQSTHSHKVAVPRFILVAGSGLLINYGMLTMLLSLGAHAVIAQILTTIGVLIWNYVVNGIWTFRKKAS